MTDYTAIAQAYIDTWNADDAASRRLVLARHWDPSATYCDPLMSGAGQDGIAQMIETARAGFPGHSFALNGAPDGHGAHLRFRWALAPAGGTAVAEGTDMVRLNEGRIAEVVGFLDLVPG